MEALDALWRASASGRPFALVLLDARMPGIDGLAVAESILQSPELSPTRIILLTSDDLHGEVARYRELGIAAYAMKPVQQEELLEIIYRVLSRPGPIEAVGRRLGWGLGRGWAVRRRRRTGRHPRARLRILVAEDNLFNQQLVDHLLRRRGHDVVVARDGRKALDALDHSTFDLMLLDVQMPEYDGFQVIEVAPAARADHGRPPARHRADRPRDEGEIASAASRPAWTITCPSRSAPRSSSRSSIA